MVTPEDLRKYDSLKSYVSTTVWALRRASEKSKSRIIWNLRDAGFSEPEKWLNLVEEGGYTPSFSEFAEVCTAFGYVIKDGLEALALAKRESEKGE